MLLIERVLGSRLDPALAGQLHDLGHHGRIDTIALPTSELARRRFVARSSAGEDVAVALPRDQKLFDGAVLLLQSDRALVVRVDRQQWLRLQPHAARDALELGYHAGNLHWRVRFDGEALLVALEAPAEDYLARLQPLLDEQRLAVAVIDDV